MASVTSNFTAAGVGTPILVRHGESLTYALSGTYSGSAVLERSVDAGQSWQPQTAVLTADLSGTIVVELPSRGAALFRWRCVSRASGTLDCVVADVTEAGPSQTLTNSLGDPVLKLLDDGSGKFIGALDVDGAFNADGAATLASTLAVTGAAAFSAAINSAQGANIASASTINLDTATGNLVDVTGTTTITAVTLSQGRLRVVRFTGALTLTHGASLVLPGAANITTAAGDMAIFAGYATGVVRLVAYMKLASIAATVDGTETLTNKTLTSPVANNPTIVASSGLNKRFSSFKPAALTTGTSTTPDITKVYVCPVWIDANCTLTGIAVSNGATVGTDKYIVALFDSTGAAVANSALAGTTTAGADAYQSVDFTAPVAVTGPKLYFIALYVNGTTDRFRTIPAVGAYAGPCGEVGSQTFGTVAAITVPTTFTADKGPVAFTY